MWLCALVVFLVAYGPEARADEQEDAPSHPDELPEAEDTLQYAFIIFRHGIRSPLTHIYRSEDEYPKRWPNGEGQLTKIGQELMLHVGKSLKTRYKDLVPEFDDNKVKITATLSPRAQLSARLVSQGMFNLPDPSVPLTPTEDYDKTYLFDLPTPSKPPCPSYEKIRDSVISEEKSRTTKSREQFFEKLTKYLKESKIYKCPKDKIEDLNDLFRVWDTLLMEVLDRQTVEQWVAEVMPQMTRLGQYRLFVRIHGKEGMIRYYAGLFFNQLLKEMATKSADCLVKQFVDRAVCPPQLHLHGSHDISVQSLYWALTDGHDDRFLATPGDSLIVELHHNSRVKVYLYSPLSKKKDKFRKVPLKSLCVKKHCTLQYLKNALSIRNLVLRENEFQSLCEAPPDLKAVYRLVPPP